MRRRNFRSWSQCRYGASYGEWFALDGEIGRRLGFDFYATDQLERYGRGPILGRVMTTQSSNRNKLTVSLLGGRFRIGDLVVVKSDPDRSYDIHTLSTYPDKQLMTFTTSTRLAEKDELVGLSWGHIRLCFPA